MLGCVAIVAVVGAAGAWWFTRSRGPSYPSKWDAQVAPVAARVEELRGLHFEHPVQVDYLPSAEFEKKVAVDPDDLREDRDEIEQRTGILRAAGLIGAKVDLADAVNTTRTADVIGLYDPDTKRIYVRGKDSLDAYARVTLAHELTHVLQDQYFDLSRVHKRAADSKSGSSDALRALLEGDANRVEDAYRKKQSKSDQAAYDRIEADYGKQAAERTSDVPAVVSTYLSAPYAFGPAVIGVLEAEAGNDAINRAIKGPTPSTRIYFDPTSVGARPETLVAPRLAAGEKKFEGDPEGNSTFGPFDLYLMLASRLDPKTAIAAIDALSAGSLVGYTKGGTACFRASVKGRTEGATRYLSSALRRWVQTVPAAAIERDSSVVTFHTCDPGERAVTPGEEQINRAMRLAVTRDAITAEVAKDSGPGIAACYARLVVTAPDLYPRIVDGRGHPEQPTANLELQLTAATLACRSDADSGIPGA